MFKYSGFHFKTVLKRIDLFGMPLPAFNLQGETVIRTKTGGIVTCIIMIILLAYGSFKLMQVFDPERPQVTYYTEKVAFDSEVKRDLNKINFKFAVSVENYFTRELRDSERYLKYFFRIFGMKNGEPYQQVIPSRRCNETDWEQFPPPSKDSRDAFEDIKTNAKRGMYCMDMKPEEKMEIFGNENNREYQRIEVIITPCNYINTEFGYKGDFIDPECVDN